MPTSQTDNLFVQVSTYQKGFLGLLLNKMCFASTANARFKSFNDIQANLGSTVNFDLMPRMTSADTLVANFQPVVQRLQSLVCSQSANVSYNVTSQEMIFNFERYVDTFAESATAELASKVEIDLAKNANSSVTIQDANNPNFGSKITDSGPFRFFGNGITPINSFQQLAQMHSNFDDFGSLKGRKKVYLPLTRVPEIVGSGMNQFTPRRNDETANSWEIGQYGSPEVDYYSSNLLPIQNAGNVGNDGTTLTLVSTNDPTGKNITQLTFSGASASDVNAIKSGDLAQFQDSVAGQVNVRFLTFIGHAPCDQPVQFRATADAGSNGGGQVTVNILPALCSVNGDQNQNLSRALTAGMQVKFLPSHRCGLVTSGNALFLAMPRLPDLMPFPTTVTTDLDSGVSIRMYRGAVIFGNNLLGWVQDCTWGSTLVPEDSMRMVFPV